MMGRHTFFIIILWFPFNLNSQSANSQWDYYAQNYTKNLRANLDLAAVFADSAYLLATKLKSDTLLLESYSFLVEVFRYEGNVKKQKEFIDNGLQLNEKLRNPYFQTFFTNALGLWNWKNGDLQEALEEFFTVRELASANKDTLNLIKSNNNIGLILADESNYAESAKYFRDGLEYASAFKDSFGIGLLLGNLSNHYRATGDNKEALAYIKKSIELHTSLSNNIEMVRGYINMGATFHRLYELDSALWAFSKAQLIPEGLTVNNKVKLFYHAGEIYAAKGAGQQVLESGREVLKIAVENNLPDDIKYGHEMISMGYEMLGDTKHALAHFKNFKSVEDSLFTLESRAAIEELQIKYDITEKEKVLQEKTLALVNLEADRQKMISRFILALSALLFGLISWIFYSYRKSNKDREKGRKKMVQRILTEREEERKNVAKELHDSIGQNLLFLKTSWGESSLPLLDKTIEEVRGLSRELFPWQIEKLGLSKAVENLVDVAGDSSKIFFSSEIEDVDTLFTPEQSIQIYRIIQECISNIIKHSEAGAAKVSIEKENKRVNLVIQDNGKGIQNIKEFVKGSINSLGMTTLRERINALEGFMDVKQNIPKGLKYQFEIPLS